MTVASGLVLFRAPDVPTALTILSSMWGLDGTATLKGFDVNHANALITLLGAVALLMPNTQQVLHLDWPVTDQKPEEAARDAGLLEWRPSVGPAVATAAVFTLAITSIGAGTSFLYYQF
jgi:alginate O-acetyltransferase complex protein AlgI